jgi:hypothetical protein
VVDAHPSQRASLGLPAAEVVRQRMAPDAIELQDVVCIQRQLDDRRGWFAERAEATCRDYWTQ